MRGRRKGKHGVDDLCRGCENREIVLKFEDAFRGVCPASGSLKCLFRRLGVAWDLVKAQVVKEFMEVLKS